jgi:hypothetical protein
MTGVQADSCRDLVPYKNTECISKVCVRLSLTSYLIADVGYPPKADSSRDLVPYNDSLDSDSDTESNSSQGYAKRSSTPSYTDDTRLPSDMIAATNVKSPQQSRKTVKRRVADDPQDFVEPDLVSRYESLTGPKLARPKFCSICVADLL